MSYSPQSHRRRSLRLEGFDYSQCGAYFITIVVHNREQLLGSIIADEMRLNAIGLIADRTWKETLDHFPNMECDCYRVMPNHFHAIVMLNENAEKAILLGKIVAYYKYQTTKAINLLRGTPGMRFWQRNYYDHIIRSEDDYRIIYDYVQYNPIRWSDDMFSKDS